MGRSFPITEDQARSLYGSHQARVFRFALLATHQPTLAADITQETFIRAFRAYDSYDSRLPFEPWLLKIAVNVTRTLLAKSRRTVPALLPDRGGEAPSPEAIRLAAEESEALWDALSHLTERQRELVILHFYNDLPLTVCAQTLGIPAGTAKSRLAAALAELRRLLPVAFREGGNVRG